VLSLVDESRGASALNDTQELRKALYWGQCLVPSWCLSRAKKRGSSPMEPN
jgi:hypothetical protein